MPDAVAVSQATILAGIIIANLAGLLGGYVSIKVALARLEVKVDKLEIDARNLGDMIKNKRGT